MEIIKEEENYGKLTLALDNIKNKFESLEKIVVDGKEFTIKWFLGGDCKLLACVCGISSTTSNQPCIWCKCLKCLMYTKYDEEGQWSLLDEEKGARTVRKIQDSASLNNKIYVKHAPIFVLITLGHLIIDTLHLFLRICFCKLSGYNIKTCTQTCTKCSNSPCCFPLYIGKIPCVKKST